MESVGCSTVQSKCFRELHRRITRTNLWTDIDACQRNCKYLSDACAWVRKYAAMISFSSFLAYITAYNVTQYNWSYVSRIEWCQTHKLVGDFRNSRTLQTADNYWKCGGKIANEKHGLMGILNEGFCKLISALLSLQSCKPDTPSQKKKTLDAQATSSTSA
jgi:hypothetical protein